MCSTGVAPANKPNRLSFTKKAINLLSPPTKKSRAYVYDEKVNGLGLTITQRGAKSFFVYRRVNGRPQRITLGKYPDMSVEAARKQAMETMAKIANGSDPLADKRAKRIAKVTLAEVFAEYLTVRSELKPNTVLDYQKTLNQTCSDWLSKPMENITRDMVLMRHKRRSKESPSRANNAMRVLRALFNFAIARYRNAKGTSLITENPVSVLSDTRAWNKIQRKRSYISPSDIAKWYEAVRTLPEVNNQSHSSAVSDYLLFLLFTGCRKSEASELLWVDVCLQERSITFRDTKNSDTAVLPMSMPVRELLAKRRDMSDAKYVFAGNQCNQITTCRRQIDHIKATTGITFSLHDLRRTFITIGESLDISHYTLKRLVNHRTQDSIDVTAGYVVPNMARLMMATEKIAECILAMVENKSNPRLITLRPSKVA